MKISNITKILPIALAFTMCSAFAAHDPVKVDYQLTLPDFVQIEVDKASHTSETTFAKNYAEITVTNPFQTVYTVYSNAIARNIVLSGSCLSAGGENNAGVGGNAIRHVDADTFYLVFTNNTHLPDATTVTNIITGTASGVGAVAANSNANAIGFEFTLVPERIDGPDLAKAIYTTTWDAEKGGILYKIQNGKLTMTYTMNANSVPNTFNTQDMSGTYKATITMTDYNPTSL